MGLFSKDSPAEKRLKELTGGFLISSDFLTVVERYGLSSSDGESIRRQVKKEIKESKSDNFNVSKRIHFLLKERAGLKPDEATTSGIYTLTKTCSHCKFVYAKDLDKCPSCGHSEKHLKKSQQYSATKNCPHCNKEISKNLTQCPFCYKNVKDNKSCPKCGTVQSEDNVFCINCGTKFMGGESTKTCPICQETQDENNMFCIICGYDFLHDEVNSNYRICSNCGKKQYIGSKKCTECGYNFKTQKMPDIVKKCPKCGLIQKAGNHYCRKCKSNLKDVDFEGDDLIKCSHCGRKIPNDSDVCPFCKHDFTEEKLKIIEEKKRNDNLERLKPLNFQRKNTFLHNFDFNIKTCPDCGEKLLKADAFCFNCGGSVITSDTERNDNLEVKDGRLTAKTDEINDELTDLEALYSHAVQSRYAPMFKVAYVLYLEAFKNNPLKKFPDKTAKKYGTTVKKLEKQAREDGFIEPAPAIVEARKSKVTDLKDILKQHNLKVSGKKEELIQRLQDNLTEAEFEKYFKSRNYQISAEGLEFLNTNKFILYILSDKDIERVFYPSEIGKIFEEKPYTDEEIRERILNHLKKTFDTKLTDETWVDFKIYANAIAQVLEDNGDLKEALKMRFKVFLFDINNYSVVLDRPDAVNVSLKKKDMVKLTALMHTLTLPIDDLKSLFDEAFEEVLFKTQITKKDSLIYLLKIFGGEEPDSVSAQIRETYSNPY